MGVEYIRNHCPEKLSPEEEIACGKRARRGRNKLTDQNKLIEHNARLVPHIAQYYTAVGIDIDELTGAGLLGLVKAAKKFDERRGKFSVLASFMIRQEIRNCLALMSKPVSYPGFIVTDKAAVARKLAAAAESGQAVYIRDIAKAIGRSRKTAKIVLADYATGVPLDVPTETGRTLAEVLPDKESKTPSEEAEYNDMVLAILREIELLPKREQFVAVHHFGIRGHEPKTLEAIGQMLKLTRERVRQIKDEVINKVRRALQNKNEHVPAPKAPQKSIDTVSVFA